VARRHFRRGDKPWQRRTIAAPNSARVTAQFDLSHHPAMAVPCGMSDGMPVSMMLIGKHFDEPTIYRATFAFEHSGDWMQM
jgi:amidase